ncbi:hypothetical protein HLRTI_001517 [Halorhabdus tiamatea SARL4B]|uniref:Envelope protein N-terminal domain-containing protein n=1 Tax=Halorhabdus tiamatea SARL4B TaxID=1033806 RepID=F7PFL9_9EURY|nr:hypothetical protein [Halorhabdus tiamatea]ERJ06438.1 hypothetical protein HLRTI_001517 [Halorhabdus tiamatea SARL4B]CCQ34322.1 conserved hypothetical protein [Halorhabdus tiamatea SARL4B]
MSTRRHIAAVALIALLVLSPIASTMSPVGPVGTATADSDGCSLIEQIFNPATCTAAEAINDFAPSEEFANKLDAYNNLQQAESYIDNGLTSAENSVYDAENQGWLEAESAFFEAYQAGDNYTEAKEAGLDALADHYATRQKQLIELQNNVVTDLYTTLNESKHFSMPGDVSALEYGIHTYSYYPQVVLYTTDHGYGYTHNYPTTNTYTMSIDIVGVQAQPRELVDGTTKQTTTFKFGSPNETYYGLNSDGTWQEIFYDSNNEFSYWSQSHYSLLEGETEVRIAPSSGTDYDDMYWANISSVRALHYPDDYPLKTAKTNGITDPSRWHDIWTDYEESYQEQKAAFETFANNSYHELENGGSDFAITDLLSRLSQMNEYSLDLGGNATFNEGVIALSSQGLAAPGANTSYMNITYQTSPGGNQTTVDGMLMSQEEPIGGWETDVWYNTTDVPGAQIVVELDGSQHLVRGDFRLNGVFDSQGVEISDPNLSSPDRDFQATNLSGLRQDIRNMSDRIADIRNQTATPGGGGGSGSFAWPSIGIPNPFAALGALGQWIVLFVVALGALLLLSVVN